MGNSAVGWRVEGDVLIVAIKSRPLGGYTNDL